MKNPWRKLSSKIVYRNPWIKVREDKVIRPDKKRNIYGVIETTGSSAIVAIDEQEYIYLIKQWRYPLDQYTLELPWGGRKKQETYWQAAKRELREEAGLTAKRWKALGKIADCPGIVNEFAYLYLAQNLAVQKPIVLSEEGVQKVMRVPFIKAYRWALQGRIQDAVCVAGIARAKLYL